MMQQRSYATHAVDIQLVRPPALDGNTAIGVQGSPTPRASSATPEAELVCATHGARGNRSHLISSRRAGHGADPPRRWCDCGAPGPGSRPAPDAVADAGDSSAG